MPLTEPVEDGTMQRLLFVLARRRRGHPRPIWHERPLRLLIEHGVVVRPSRVAASVGGDPEDDPSRRPPPAPSWEPG